MTQRANVLAIVGSYRKGGTIDARKSKKTGGWGGNWFCGQDRIQAQTRNGKSIMPGIREKGRCA